MNGYLMPRTVQIIGLVVFILAAAFWALTDKESALIMGFATSLIGLGAYSRTVDHLAGVIQSRQQEPRSVQIVADYRKQQNPDGN